jgi:sugar phosphate isomerase/epimerase
MFMKTNHIGVQVYTLREFMKTREDYIDTLHKIADMGYTAIQANRPWPLEDAELLDTLDKLGITLSSIHDDTVSCMANPEEAVERNRHLPTKHVALPIWGRVDLTNKESVDAWLKQLNRTGEIFHQGGLQLSYHHHAAEFYRLGNRTIMDMIFEETNPEWVQWCMDVFWIQTGGGSPLEWVQRARNRLPILHLKDYKIKGMSKESEFAEVGNGNINFSPILKAAYESGCRWFMVEQDICPGNPFDSIRQSLQYLKALPDPY